MENLRINPGITIPGACLQAEAVRSSGPGGQNVNKLSTKVFLFFDLAACGVLREDVKERLRHLAGRRLDRDDRIRIASQRHRSRERNLEECRTRLAGLVRAALRPPTPRKKTAPPRRAARERLESKRRTSHQKALRRRPPQDDE